MLRFTKPQFLCLLGRGFPSREQSVQYGRTEKEIEAKDDVGRLEVKILIQPLDFKSENPKPTSGHLKVNT